MKRILIIDDSADLLEAMRIFLELKDFKVRTQVDCKNITEIIQSFDPDVVIMDIFLKGEDGREVCKKLRQQENTKHLCILLLSGTPEIVLRYKEYGADSYLEKPFDINKLLEKIEQVLALCDESKFKI